MRYMKAWSPHRRRRRDYGREMPYDPRNFNRRNPPDLPKLKYYDMSTPDFLGTVNKFSPSTSRKDKITLEIQDNKPKLRSPVVSRPIELLEKWDWNKRPMKDLTRHIVAKQSAKNKKHLLVLPGSTARDTDILKYYGVGTDDSLWTLVEKDDEEFGDLRERTSESAYVAPDGIFDRDQFPGSKYYAPMFPNSLVVDPSKPPAELGDTKALYYRKDVGDIYFKDEKGKPLIKGSKEFDFIWLDLLGNLTANIIFFLKDRLTPSKDLDLFFTFTATQSRGAKGGLFNVLKKTLWQMGDYQIKGPATGLTRILENIEGSRSSPHYSTKSKLSDHSIAIHYALFKYIFSSYNFDCDSWLYDDGKSLEGQKGATWMIVYHLHNFSKLKRVNPYKKLIDKVGATIAIWRSYGEADSPSRKAKETMADKIYQLVGGQIKRVWGLDDEKALKFIDYWIAITGISDKNIYKEFDLLQNFNYLLVGNGLYPDSVNAQLEELYNQLQVFNPPALHQDFEYEQAGLRPKMDIEYRNNMVVIKSPADELDPNHVPQEYRISIDTAKDLDMGWGVAFAGDIITSSIQFDSKQDAEKWIKDSIYDGQLTHSAGRYTAVEIASGLMYSPAALPGESKPGAPGSGPNGKDWPTRRGKPIPAVSELRLTPIFLAEINRVALYSMFRNIFRGDRYLHPQLCSMAGYTRTIGGKTKSCFTLSDPQRHAITKFALSISSGENKGIVNLPTGMGKTIVATRIVDEFIKHQKKVRGSERILFLTDNKLILDGSIDKFKEHTRFKEESDYCRFYGSGTAHKTQECMDRKLVFASTSSLRTKHKKLEKELKRLSDKLNQYGRDFGSAFTPKDDRRRNILLQTAYKYLPFIRWGQFGLIIIDEAHHAAAKTWFMIINHCLEMSAPTRRERVPQDRWNELPYLLGMTATPFRGDALDVDEIFNNNFLVRMGLNRGIWEGYLAWPYYRLFDDGVLRRLKQRMIDRKEPDLDLKDLHARKAISPAYQKLILKAYLEAAKGQKGIVFCSRIEGAISMAEYFNNQKSRKITKEHKAVVDKEAQKMPSVRSIVIHSDMRSQELKIVSKQLGKSPPYKTLGELKRNVPTIFQRGVDLIFAVNIFNEGVDMPEIEVLVKLNKTVSPVVNVQQLGRGLRLYPFKRDVIVLDFTGNYRTLDALYNLQQYVYHSGGGGGRRRKHPRFLPEIPPKHFNVEEDARVNIRYILDEARDLVAHLSYDEQEEIKEMCREGYSYQNIIGTMTAERQAKVEFIDEEVHTGKKTAEEVRDDRAHFGKVVTRDDIKTLCADIVPSFDQEYISKIDAVILFSELVPPGGSPEAREKKIVRAARELVRMMPHYTLEEGIDTVKNYLGPLRTAGRRIVLALINEHDKTEAQITRMLTSCNCGRKKHTPECSMARTRKYLKQLLADPEEQE